MKKTKENCIREKLQRGLLIAGGLCGALLLFCAARVLFETHGGSFGALERRVGGYIEHALVCFLIPAGGAAVIEWIGRGDT